MLNCQSYPETLSQILNIQQALSQKPEDLEILGLKCYLCERVGHMAIHCENYCMFKGNIEAQAIESLHLLEEAIRRQVRQRTSHHKIMREI